ncbi:DUF2634 domain-containing protein [Paenibacillus aquistagni]|uniref:DUF2634 domain-containing protein n=1 Tax=Paenibacillus aquistagni TaxID=1852522 RepID=A0A1X7LYJ8_9BACL|nr:DUF2634 domain-containing protein [Paenibacillus aquistagni]SMG58189.1 Protein of unknown function [Paenibacillus aquistagni]
MNLRWGRCSFFDFNERKHVLVDGKPILATYEEAIKQWLTMLLITEPDKYRVYRGTSFGIELAHFIGRRDLPIGVILSETKRQIEEKALLHPEILEVDEFEIRRSNGVAEISFTVTTKRGGIIPFESEVKYSG